MLSRVAERVYWQARYLERVENTARLLNVFSGLLLDLPKGTKLGWRTLVEITGTEDAFDGKYKQSSERNVIRFLLAENNGFSILDLLALTRENSRTTREVMPTEAFEQINELYYFAKENAASGVDRGARYQLLEEIINCCQQIWGLMAGTMSRDAAYSFVRIGRALERADMTTRVVDVGSGNLMPSVQEQNSVTDSAPEPYENILWMNILRSQSAYQMYRQHVRFRVNAEDVVRFLLLNEEFPRSTHHNLITLTKVLHKLPNNTRVTRQINKTKRLLKDADIEKLLRKGLLKHIDNLQLEMAAIHFTIAETWFLPNK
ncbi:MAG: alpha-E domain-containing protein [Pseudomonadales bacterium]|nr:alpha-E domain-containing protein [Pseudomonadales bacterium]